jgi:hypothetical protein
VVIIGVFVRRELASGGLKLLIGEGKVLISASHLPMPLLSL